MKLGSVSKLYKRNKGKLKNFGDDVMLENCVVISILRFVANFEQPGRRILDA